MIDFNFNPIISSNLKFGLVGAIAIFGTLFSIGHAQAKQEKLTSAAVYSVDKGSAKIVKVQLVPCHQAQLNCMQSCANEYNSTINNCNTKLPREQTACKSQAMSRFTSCSSGCYSSNPCP